MELNPDGYLRPQISEPLTAAQDSLIDAVCPGGRLDYIGEASQFTTVWGPVVSTHVGFATDSGLRYSASSGGVVSALAQHAIDTGQAEYVLHVGAQVEVPWLNETRQSRDPAAVAAGAGSRYAPSSPLADIVQQLERGGRAFVVGKPCDIAGLRMYARKNPLVDQKVSVMLAFMCGGVPSARGIEMLLRRMNVTPEEVVSFRYRGYGWPGEACATLKNGEQKTLSYAETWGSVLSHHVQKRCKICPDGMGIFGDIVCGDGWYGDERGYPTFDERDGRSLIISRTETGSAFLREAHRNGCIDLQPITLPDVAKMQPSQVRRTQLTLSRILAMYILGRQIPRFRGLHLIRAGLQAGFVANMKSFLGAFRRIFRGNL
jgi:coenzyme F420 hydrogenase subunit beta